MFLASQHCIIFTPVNFFSTCPYDKWDKNECMRVCLMFFAMDNSDHLKHFTCVKYNLTHCYIACLTKEKSGTQRCFSSVKKII